MKKLFKMLLICSCAAVLLIGCGEKPVDQEEEQEQEQEKPQKKKLKKEDVTVTPEVVLEETERFILCDGYRVFVCKGDEAKEIYSTGGVNDVVDEAKLIDELIYVIETEDSEVDGYHTYMHVYDLMGREVYNKDFGTESGAFFVDLYNDDVFLSLKAGYGENNRQVYVFDTSNYELSFDEYHTDMWNAIDCNGISLGRNQSLFGVISEQNDEFYGWSSESNLPVIVDKSTLTVKYYLPISGLGNSLNYIGQLGNRMLVQGYDPETYYLINVDNNSYKEFKEIGDYYYLDKDDRNFYLSKNESSVYGLSNYVVCSLDSEYSAVTELYSATEKPGDNTKNYFSPGVTGFTSVNGYLYSLNSDGTSYYWQPYSLSDSCWSTKRIASEAYDFADIMTIDYESMPLYTADEPNVPYFNSYFETPHILPEVSEHADEINAQIDEYMEKDIKGRALSFSEDALDNTQYCTPEDFGYTFTFDWYIKGAELIGDDYVEIRYAGYEYSGGVHGYPYLDQLLFRRSTGERVQLADIIGVDEQMFSRIVAAKTVADNKEAAEYKYFYDGEASDNDSEYFNEIMSYACTFDALPISYEQDGIRVYFPPYLIGPYSSGFIDIFISYDELNMKMN